METPSDREAAGRVPTAMSALFEATTGNIKSKT
jgi:hypothetical protein